MISAGGSLLGNLFGFGSQAATNKAQMELAKYQYEKNLEMWNRQNEYNLPSAQRQRLIDAGLNPALMYGSGHISNTAADAPSYDAPHLGAFTNFGDLGASGSINAYLSASRSVAEIDNIEEDTNVKKWNQELVQMQRYQIINDIAERQLCIARTRIEMKFWEGIAASSYDKLKKEVDNLDLQGDYIKANTRGVNASAAYTEEQTKTVEESRPYIIDNLIKEGKHIDAQTYAQLQAGNASKAQVDVAHSMANYYSNLSAKAVQELKFLTTDQQRQLKAHVDDVVFSAALKGQQLTKAKLENEMLKFMQRTGINLNTSGYQGIFNEVLYWLWHGAEGFVGSQIPMSGSYEKPQYRQFNGVNPVTGR